MNFNNFTIKSQEAVQKATEIAAAKQNQAIESAHLLRGMLTVDENVIPYLLRKLNVNLDLFTQALDRIIDGLPKVSGGEQFLSNDTTKALQKAISGGLFYPSTPFSPGRKGVFLKGRIFQNWK